MIEDDRTLPRTKGETGFMIDQPVRWIISPTSDQLVQRRCAKCDTKRLFALSHRFRVNANKKTLDVWHIYKCIQCDDTWNVEIISRRNRRDIPTDLLNSFLVNDANLARRYSFDYQLLFKHSVEFADPPAIEVRGANITEFSNREELMVVLEPEFLLRNRLGAVLSKKLGHSYSHKPARGERSHWRSGGAGAPSPTKATPNYSYQTEDLAFADRRAWRNRRGLASTRSLPATAAGNETRSLRKPTESSVMKNYFFIRASLKRYFLSR